MSYHPNKEWLATDKEGDFLYFYDLKELAKYFDWTYNEAYAVAHFSIRRINMPSPSKGVYIQRLYNDPNRTSRTKNINFHRSHKYIYPNIVND